MWSIQGLSPSCCSLWTTCSHPNPSMVWHRRTNTGSEAVWPWASYLMSLSLSFLIYNMRVIRVPLGLVWTVKIQLCVCVSASHSGHLLHNNDYHYESRYLGNFSVEERCPFVEFKATLGLWNYQWISVSNSVKALLLSSHYSSYPTPPPPVQGWGEGRERTPRAFHPSGISFEIIQCWLWSLLPIWPWANQWGDWKCPR